MCGKRRRLGEYHLSRIEFIRICWECRSTKGLRSIAARLAPKLRTLARTEHPYFEAKKDVDALLETWSYAKQASKPFPPEPDNW
jgi:hypothetical protein